MQEEVQETLKVKVSNIPHTVLWLLIPIEGIGVVAFIIYLLYHFQSFVGQSVTIFNWLVWFAGLGLYVGLGVLAVKLTRSGVETVIALGKGLADIVLSIGNGFVDIQRKKAEVEHIKASTMLLHTAEGYVVHKEGGRIVVTPIPQVGRYPVQALDQTTVSMVDSDVPQQLNPNHKSFRQLIEDGTLSRVLQMGKMVFGYRTNGELRLGSWLDLYSVGVGGLSGTGKSTTVRNFLFQSILGKGKFIMVDPHISDEQESLAAQFRMFTNIHLLPPCDGTPKEVEKRIKWMKEEYFRRHKNGIKGPPIVFILDEFNELVRFLPDEIKKELADLLLTIAQGGRKFGIFAMIIAQRWSQQDLGGYPYGAAIRSSLSSILAHRLRDEGQAKALVGSKDSPRCTKLTTGHYLFSDTQGGLEEIITPDNSWKDVELIQQMLNSQVAGLLPETIDYEGRGNTSENTGESTTKVHENTEPLYTESTLIPEKYDENTVLSRENTEIHTLAVEVIKMQQEGKNKTDIMRKLWNVNPGDNEPYRQATSQYGQVMTYIVERLLKV
jgi:hypothetical protein